VRLQRTIQVLASVLILLGGTRLWLRSSDRAARAASSIGTTEERKIPSGQEPKTVRVYEARDILDAMLAEVSADDDPRPHIKRNWEGYGQPEYGAPRPKVLDLSPREAVIELTKQKLERLFGNSEGRAHVIDGKVYVRETPAGHREIERLLAAMRQMKNHLELEQSSNRE
jgi:hypothetical protein